MKITVVGVGYVGLVTGACLAEMGYHVNCLDIDAQKIEKLNQGTTPFYEKQLDEIIARNSHAQRLHFTTDYKSSVEASDVIFLALPTPQGDDGHAEMRYLMRSCRSVAEAMNGYKLIVNKSTAPVGTAKEIEREISETLKKRGASFPFDVVSNPEFLMEGDAVNTCLKPDRIIIGTESAKAEAILRKLYSGFNLQSDRIIVMDVASAELCKYASNAMLALRVSFMNEIANVCESVGANVDWIRKGMGADERIGPAFLYAGVGFGGSCFPKDLAALMAQGNALNQPMKTVQSALEVNTLQKQRLPQKITHYFSTRGGVEGKTIGILGLSFKPETDDLREAPSLEIIRSLRNEGAFIRVFDPIAMEGAKSLLAGDSEITFCEDEYACARDADAIALVTEWKQFRSLDLSDLLKHMKGRAFFDGRNQYHASEMVEQGFDYFSIGRAPAYAPGNKVRSVYPTEALIDPELLESINAKK